MFRLSKNDVTAMSVYETRWNFQINTTIGALICVRRGSNVPSTTAASVPLDSADRDVNAAACSLQQRIERINHSFNSAFLLLWYLWTRERRYYTIKLKWRASLRKLGCCSFTARLVEAVMLPFTGIIARKAWNEQPSWQKKRNHAIAKWTTKK